MQEILFCFVIVMTMMCIMPNIFRHHHFLFYRILFTMLVIDTRLSVLAVTLTDGMTYAVARLRSANLQDIVNPVAASSIHIEMYPVDGQVTS
jgi:hypothetical protein